MNPFKPPFSFSIGMGEKKFFYLFYHIDLPKDRKEKEPVTQTIDVRPQTADLRGDVFGCQKVNEGEMIR